jgi:cytochrome c oxidase subunit II
MPVRIQSALDAAGIQAARIEWLWWLMFWVTAGGFVVVVAAVFLAVRRGRSPDAIRPADPSLWRAVGASVGVTIVILFGLLYASAATGRAIASRPADKPLVIQITGQQWWWSIEYLDDAPSQHFTTANELHIPVGRPIVLNLRSPDVIHSFWVPNLHGKMDLIPGRLNTTWLRADVPGVYRGQCAEFCGMQHAHMAFLVVAEPSEDYERWANAQRQNAPEPSTPEQLRGRGIVERGPCALCHTVRGTQAGARTAPDLTHVASRSTIAAATAPNAPGYLAGWVANPQHLKPGNHMPATGLSAADLQAVLAYLETLR